MQEMWELAPWRERRYTMPPSTDQQVPRINASEDLHAWSIYRQNLNSDITDSALGSAERSPLPYGNFQLRESTVKSILNNPRYGPKSELGSNMFTYLKFGLPRVFPPTRTGRDGSSGYDSSDDGSPVMRRTNYKRSKSDPDFRNNVMSHHPSGKSYQFWENRKARSSSEANLLSSDAYYREKPNFSRKPDAHSDIGLASFGQRSLAGSRVGSVSSRAQGPFGVLSTEGSTYRPDTSMLNHKYFPRDTGIEEGAQIKKHPHLQARALGYENKFGGKSKVRGPYPLLESVSFEARGGELLAVMATSELEGRCLLELLAGTKKVWQGEILINGSHASSKSLRSRVAYASQNTNFTADMSVQQTLMFHSLLVQPARRQRNQDRKGRINALINDLGLGQVKHTRVRELTMSEKYRLNAACHLLDDTDILLLDQPTKDMDIFDTFFLVEYLRQWSLRGRIIILTIHPPTYEIFSMISKVVLLSTGRVMYYGHRRDMLPYFAYIEYPCPAYKNPSDYYVDLVTLDDLSADARLESSQRVDQLADTFNKKQEPLSDPGPPSLPPPKFHRSNIIMQVIALWIRAMIYLFPYNVVNWLFELCQAALLSVAIGAIYWKLRAGEQDQQHVNDRVGFHYAMTALVPWPIIFNTVNEAWHCKAPLTRDIQDGLYTKIIYIISKMIYSVIPKLCLFVTYAVIGYYMSGLDEQDGIENLYYFMVYIVLYLFCLHYMALFCAYFFSSRHTAMLLMAFLMLCVSLPSGYVIHVGNMPVWIQWMTDASPARWVLQTMTLNEFKVMPKLECSRSPTVSQENANTTILIQAFCGIETGKQAINFYGFQEPKEWFIPLVALSGYAGGFLLLGVIVFLCVRQIPKRSRSRGLNL